MELKKYEIPFKELRREYDPKMFKFECTKDLAPLKEFIGQERAIRAVEFGLKMNNDGYNMYVAGVTGIGKTTMVKTYIQKILKEREGRGESSRVEDWCYLYNFKDPDVPRIASLAQGKGKVLREQIDQLLESVKQELGRAFTGEDYKKQRQKTVEEAQAEQRKVFEQIAGEARKQGFAFQMTPMGPVLVPLVAGKPMEEKEYLALDDATRRKLEEKQRELRKKLQAAFEEASGLESGTIEKLQKADKEMAEYTVLHLFDPLLKEYDKNEKVAEYLKGLKNYITENLDLFKGGQEPINPVLGVPMSQLMGGRNLFVQFQVNVFVDNSEVKEAPVIIESNPNFANMFGKIERRFLFGGYLSDHTMLRPGALNCANGGYLLLNAPDGLTNPGVWPTLKRAIKNKEVRIEDPFEQFGLFAPQGMKPEPMPINVKVVLLGDPGLYQLLAAYDEDFWEIFKVKADFSQEIERNDKNIKDYAAFISGCCEQCQAVPFDPSGVAKIIEYSSRMVADQEKLSTRFARIKEWVQEADYWAKQEKSKYITAEHVKKAVDEKLFRHNLIDEKMREMITRGAIMIDVDGAVVGQVNGLSVYTLGDIAFGKPSRITAKTFLGRSGVIISSAIRR